MTVTELLDQMYYRLDVVMNGPEPVDDDGFYYSRFIPGDRVDDHLCVEFYPDTCDLVLRCVECDAPVA